MMNLNRIIWLASFPKSGNTWIRILLAHYFMPKEQAIDINSIYRFTTSDKRQDFFDKANGGPFETNDLDTWLNIRAKALRLIAGSKPDHHFVKTHSLLGGVNGHALIPPEVTAAGIYVMRNPFDLCLSYARHQSWTIDQTIDAMTDPEHTNGSKTGIREIIGRWDNHIQSWLTADGLHRVSLRYEDLTDDTFRAVGPIFKFLGMPADHGKLRWAIRKSSFKELQKQEAKKGFVEKPQNMTRFFHSGRAGVWREKLEPAQIGRICDAFGDALAAHYPEIQKEAEALR